MRVMIAEDSGMLRQMLVDVLSRHGLTVTGQAGSLAEILTLVDRSQPDLVVLDIRMPPGYQDEGLQAAAAIRKRYPQVGLLVLSHYAETSYAIRLLETGSGRLGYLVKDRVQDTAVLLDAIDRVAAGEVVVDPEVVHRVMFRPRTVDPLGQLTPVEREVLRLIAEGLSNQAIADKLHYSPKTVEKRISSIIVKLDLPSDEKTGRSDVNLRVLAVLTFLRRTETSPLRNLPGTEPWTSSGLSDSIRSSGDKP